MGRYYSGDIEGKFWFGVQSSDDASFFGGVQSEPNYIEFWFEKDDIEQIEQGIVKCTEALGDYCAKLDKFFDEHNGYNDEMLQEEFGISKDEVKNLLTWYARIHLGEEILAKVKETGTCEFKAEL